MRHLPTDGPIPQLDSFPDSDGRLLSKGCAVSAESDTGKVVEGNVFMLLPWGAEWFDPSWKKCTVVIRDHESGEYSNWNPQKVTKT